MTEVVLDDRRRRILAALADTFAPAVRPPAAQAGDPHGFWARRATDLDLVPALVGRLEELLVEEELQELGRLLDVLRGIGFPRLPQAARETVLKGLAATSADARQGLDGLRALVFQLFYGHVGADGHNPNWAQLSYPGPPAVEPPPRQLATWSPPAGVTEHRMSADVVVVGSGAGGGVVAGELAAAGLAVVVLEAGGHFEAPDFPADELGALQQLYWRGGLHLTADGNVAILAGATLGGGTTVNWLNCVRPPRDVRRQWADEHGLAGVDGQDFDIHLDAVLQRISANADCTDLNGVNEKLAAGASALGLRWEKATRNTDPATYDAAAAGHVGYGDRTGSKQSTTATYLRDAEANGARIVCRSRAQRILTRHGAAVGVEAVVRRPGRPPLHLTVDAPQVVVAGGALETPALLLRSAIGGPAVGRHLRLHPVPMVVGLYDEELRAWWGAPQATIVTGHRAVVDGFGYLIETAHLHPSISGAVVPWRSGRQHKLLMGRYAGTAPFLAVTRDHGSGSVTVDDQGEAVVHYPLSDPVDIEVRRHALRTLVELHAAAGASVVFDTHRSLAMWRRGEDLDAFRRQAQEAGEGAGGRVMFSAHQMGSARMGTDPTTSVASPTGELHDTRGVWIGDTSAFPTAVGSNPMLTCMALARRTAHAIRAATAATPRGPATPN
ncbi:GMC family oxidoreductase N-terminal domain-containing protein [Egicoccus sp. AB-alg6-2]|uniref:GMC family oxidoreductase N-terminal domain-containing protein n=1 Tax=Egicoccus sp. AB-alg6-2 TaxID=3242692 RepID=UPI00359DC420